MNEAYYNVDAQGGVDIVLRRSTPGRADPRKRITQVIRARTVWRPIPGRTVAEVEQINGRVSYHIVRASAGGAYDGIGSVFFNLDEKGGVLTGSIDRALLSRRDAFGSFTDIFHRPIISGKFRAAYDPRRVVRIINDMERLFRARTSGQAGTSLSRS